MRLADVIQRLRVLPSPLPQGPDILTPVLATTGEVRMMPLQTPTVRPAAVLVLVSPGHEGAAEVLLIERASYDGPHSGQIAFPGGAAEDADADPIETALREAHEEVGLDPEACGLTVIGRLDDFTIPISGFAVTPVLAVAERRPELMPDGHEVVDTIFAPLDAFLAGAPIDIVEREINGYPLRYGAFPVAGRSVWGATARILGQLAAILDDG
ncbi:MAG TPA: CoA pyrophosphatase [Candidatus Limnocylindrales bacterium]|nr:CoA pyrophosphatase [Candidatus Limnocylindrales bacterium]